MKAKQVLVVGSRGALGAAIVDALIANKWSVRGVDITRAQSHQYAYRSLSAGASLQQYQQELLDFVGSEKLDAIINASGGWAGGTVVDPNMAASADLMLRQSMYTSLVAAHLFSTHGAAGSLLVLPGAAAARAPTPTMVPYGVAKSAVHFLCKSIAADPASVPPDSRVVSLLPWTLDTPSNRSAMPDADKSSWTPMEYVSQQVVRWCDAVERPANGSLVEFNTVNGNTSMKFY